jgi:hypothetical protein
MKRFNPKHEKQFKPEGFKSLDKKNPSTRAGVVSLFAVTHQGPAQGGKAGGSELPVRNLTKITTLFNKKVKYFVK